MIATLIAALKPVPSYVVAAIILIAVTIALHALLLAYPIRRSTESGGTTKAKPPKRQQGVKAFIIGEDGRASTSRLQVVLWTYSIAFVFLALILQDLGTELSKGISTQYLYLLGIPVAGAVGARLITGAKVSTGATDKGGTAEEEKGGVGKGLAEIVSDDEGRGDLGDFQYFLFNVVALVFFFFNLFKKAADTLPEIPDTLVALTGTSALAYLTKKGVVRDLPVITAVHPAAGRAPDKIHIRGVNFVGPSAPAKTKDPTRGIVVTINGAEAAEVDASNPKNLLVTLPDNLPTDGEGVKVITASGAETEPTAFKVLT